MKIKDIKDNEWKGIVDMYLKDKQYQSEDYTLEDMLKCVRRCENCGELVLVDFNTDELPTITTWRGKTIHCCEKCILEDNEKNYEDENSEWSYFVDNFRENECM